MELKGKKNDTVCLLGTSNTLSDTKWDDENIDYWACFAVMSEDKTIQGHRLDAIFELHTIETWGLFEDKVLAAQEKYPNVPIYMQREFSQIKNSVKYPLEEVQDMVDNIYMRKYFTSSIAYMVALAVLYGYKKILLYGISLVVEEEEYSRQRSCVEAWLAFGLSRGVQFEIAQPASIMSCNYMYGYEPHKDMIIKLVQMKEAVKEAHTTLSKKMADLRDEVLIQEGGVRMMDHLIHIYRS